MATFDNDEGPAFPTRNIARASVADPSRSPILIRNSPSHSIRRNVRSTSIGSSTAAGRHREDSLLSEEDESGDDAARRHRKRRGKFAAVEEEGEGEDESGSEDGGSVEGEEGEDAEGMTLKDRQSLINVAHPFGLPIWKPALYRKERSVTRNADAALHSVPSAQAERHLLPANIFWAVAFGWWMALICVAISAILYLIPLGGDHYSSLVFGLGWYLAWPFGKYVEGDLEEDVKVEDEEGGQQGRRFSSASEGTIRGLPPSQPLPAEGSNAAGDNSLPHHTHSVSWISDSDHLEPAEDTGLLRPIKSYGATAPFGSADSSPVMRAKGLPSPDILGMIAFWLFLITVIAPILLIVCLLCWALVVTVPMAKLLWALLKHLFTKAKQIRFCAAPPAVVVAQVPVIPENEIAYPQPLPRPQFSVKHPRLSVGQVAPSGHPRSTVLLCTYRAAGLQYLKYTVGGVNIIFVNLLPVVFFVIIDGLVLLRIVEGLEEEGKHVPFLLAVIANKGLIFVMSLLSVIPLSYFIGMAVASISAQSSIGMGAVINATFGSIIEIILYGIALTQGKGLLVEGSIVGSLLAGVLLMPGMSMCSMAFRRKEQKFNAKSAGVTSMMLIMAIIGALAPTLFYQTYGNVQLVCTGCPSNRTPENAPWVCTHCYYRRPNPVSDPFYQSTVKKLMFICAGILLFSYLVGLWFSLRTHASQIWQNPQQLLLHGELPAHGRTASQKPNAQQQLRACSVQRKPSHTGGIAGNVDYSRSPALSHTGTTRNGPPSPTIRRVSQAPGFPPIMDSVDQAVKQTGLNNLQLGSTLTQEELQRVVAAATVSALRHQETHGHAQAGSRPRSTSVAADDHSAHGHDAPSWSRMTSASVLLVSTALFAIIADILVDVVDVILKGSSIDLKFLGITLFALVPNTTEFMNAISFALNGNIALSMEIGSAYALQVCLLQIPAMVAFSAWYDPKHMGEVARSFTLIFPKWDAIALILSMFLMTYTYIEAKSNYHRGSILILSYIVLIAGFYFAPPGSAEIDQGHTGSMLTDIQHVSLTFWQYYKWLLFGSK